MADIRYKTSAGQIGSWGTSEFVYPRALLDGTGVEGIAHSVNPEIGVVTVAVTPQ